MKLIEKLNESTITGWSDFNSKDKEVFKIVRHQLSHTDSFADVTLFVAHKMCHYLRINGKKITVNQFSHFFK